MKKITISALVGVILLGVIIFIVESQTEGFAALQDNVSSQYQTKEYYTVVKNDGSKRIFGGYKYTFTAYDQDGKEQSVIKNVSKKLRTGAYLKIFAKGRQGKGWYEVKENEVPENVLKKIEANR